MAAFGEYASEVFLPWIQHQLKTCDRVDMVWDVYKNNSLKDSTREKRGHGIRQKVGETTKLPRKFSDFLKNPLNKEELFEMLADKVESTTFEPGKQVYATKGKHVLSSGPLAPLPECDHEEADTRVCIHLRDALEKGAETILIRTVDTDIIVILVGLFGQLSKDYPKICLWVAFGMGQNFKEICINDIFKKLGKKRSLALPGFHSFTGCDTTSQFQGKGKKTAWSAWKSFPEVTNAFIAMTADPFQVLNQGSNIFTQLERYTCVLYDKTTDNDKVNELRKDLFAQKCCPMENIPPTQAALLQHSNRSVYQSGIWSKSLEAIQSLPSPENFGWTKVADLWSPLWTILPEAAKVCRELLKCGCKAEPLCSRKCRCRDAGLPCTALCQCAGNCEWHN